MNRADCDGVPTAATHVESSAEFASGVLQMNAWVGEIEVLTGACAYSLGVRNLSVNVFKLTQCVEAAVIAVDVEHDHARGFAG